VSNTWPGGQRRALSQGQHAEWNARHYPGTRQLCVLCEQPTGRCEDDTLFNGDTGPLCPDCWGREAEREKEGT
jgi:hypothetical protein